VTWAYIALLGLVGADLFLYFRNRRHERHLGR
jgi:hypothetical protein